MGKTKYDWTKIKLQYVTGDMSLQELAAEVQIPIDTLKKHAKADRYTEERAEYKRTVLKKVLSNMGQKDARAIDDSMTATNKAIALLNNCMTDDAALYNYVIGKSELRFKKVDTRALRNMVGALRDVACVLKTIYPDNTEPSIEQSGVVIMPDQCSEE